MSVTITSLSTTFGFLNEAPIEFHPRLTCIIGARGTCKSTIVETIRFVFDCDPHRVGDLVAEQSPESGTGPSSKGLVRATLKGGIAKCAAMHKSSSGPTHITIEREIGSTARLYREGIEELADRSVLNLIEIYSQGDLQRIADNENLRLELIDRPHKQVIAKLLAERAKITKELRDLGPRIRAKAADAEARSADVRSLDALRSQLAQVQLQRPQLSDELDRERAAAVNRAAMIESTNKWVNARETLISALTTLLTEADLPPLPAGLDKLDSDVATALHLEQVALAELGTSLRHDLAQHRSDLTPLLDTLRTACERLNSRYHALRQEQQEVNDTLKREDTLKQQIVHLERIQAELQKFEEELRQLKERRTVLRRQVTEIADKVFALRQSEVERINQRHHASIILALPQNLWVSVCCFVLGWTATHVHLLRSDDQGASLPAPWNPG